MADTMAASRELFEAIKSGDAAAVQALLDRDPSLVNATNDDALSPMIDATYRGRQEVVDLLLTRGAHIDIFAAAALGKTERLREILTRDSGGINTLSPDGFTPLALSAFFGHKDAAAILLEHGADVSARTKNFLGNMPIHSAAAGSRPDLVALLLEHGADPNARDAHGWVPLSLAAGNGNLEIVELLLARNVDLASANDEGLTALALATKGEHEAVADALRRHGAQA
ncbi:MAG: putative ankyrin [Chloroflexi bacterium]|nr:putative ankyrin [Chloroflexota bacterium]